MLPFVLQNTVGHTNSLAITFYSCPDVARALLRLSQMPGVLQLLLATTRSKYLKTSMLWSLALRSGSQLCSWRLWRVAISLNLLVLRRENIFVARICMSQMLQRGGESPPILTVSCRCQNSKGRHTVLSAVHPFSSIPCRKFGTGDSVVYYPQGRKLPRTSRELGGTPPPACRCAARCAAPPSGSRGIPPQTPSCRVQAWPAAPF